MGKKSKTVDLKPKADKISEEQLTQLQNVVSTVNKLKFDIGTVEVQKHNLLHGVFEANNRIIEIQNKFQEEYGTYDVNIQDGAINYKDEQTDKKD